MIRAVICDDEKAALDIIRYFIESEGLPIEIVGTAENGTDALKLIRKEKPDLAFVDIFMPFMNGFEVVQQVENVKIIIITAYDSFEHAQKALRMDVSDIIAKPIKLTQLRESVARAIGWKFTDNQTVNAVLAYIHQHYREQIRLDDLTKAVYCTESYIARVFKQHMDETIISYLHRIRIKAAVGMMEENQLTIREISDQVGYQSLNNFYKYFKIYMGIPPSTYMKKMAK